MRFVLELWPDLDKPTSAELVRYAIESVRGNGEHLSWDILNDDGTPIAENVFGSEPSSETAKGSEAETDPAVLAADTLSNAALVDAAREAQALNDEDLNRARRRTT